ncbi:lipopolysaccharide biosynthesis protein [Chryseobacterium lacus]|uniref:Lipopolysaccharide biosynthesis protein n=1 Tax=Chryseobacterium lacus TaxID=2058346 RepID=A0A368MXK2_9FLAO|nr:lipopolysaccharide biosynthesis protein [Chryseobacterium lacus]RCU42967.1 lipopolysaccharide biosynthesis protein [Chryseobacterium lacus]RST27817.1 lipopolysaccharide biosynthesis protein [Chryseobacterium lacus]
MTYNSKDISKGLFWSAVDKFGFVALQLVLELILARLLLPRDYGVIAIVLVFVTLSLTLTEGGFSNALIQKLNRTEKDFSTVFYFNILAAAIIYLVIFLAAPSVEAFFNIENLATILRVISLSIIFNSSIMVHKAKLSIAMDFRLQAKYSLLSVFLSGGVAVWLAFDGYGVWALVYQNLLMTLFNALFLWIGYRWTPDWVFSFNSLKSLLSFGSKIMISAIIQAVYFNAYPILIGRVLRTADLGLYTKASQFTQMPASVLTNVLQRVLFPFFSSHQNDNDKLFQLNQFYTTVCCLIFFPLFFIMAAVAQPLIIFLFSEVWADMAPVFTLLCMGYAFYPLIVNNMMLFQVKNKTTLFLKIEIITKIIGFAILLLTVKHGILAIGYGILIQQVLQFLITSFFAQTVLNKSLLKQIAIVSPPFLISFAIFVAVHFLVKDVETVAVKLISGSTLALVSYGLIYFLFYRNILSRIIAMAKK